MPKRKPKLKLNQRQSDRLEIARHESSEKKRIASMPRTKRRKAQDKFEKSIAEIKKQQKSYYDQLSKEKQAKTRALKQGTKLSNISRTKLEEWERQSRSLTPKPAGYGVPKKPAKRSSGSIRGRKKT